MLDYNLVENLPRDQWNAFLEKFSFGNFEQLFEYGDITRKAFSRTNVLRLACFDRDKIVGILQGIYQKYFGLGSTLEVKHGPVVNLNDVNSVQIVKFFLDALENHAKSEHIYGARILVPQEWQIDDAFRLKGYAFGGWLNEYIVNLENGVDWLWKHISHNKRKNIKKGLTAGVEVFESREKEDLLTFYSMLRAAEERAGFKSYPLSWFETILNVCPEFSRIFLARWNGKNVSGVFIIMHCKTVFALAAGSLTEGWKVRSNDVMHWKVMEWASQRGYLKYHMGFVTEPPPMEGSPSWGIWRWKKEWNGNLEKLKIYQKFFHTKYKLIFKVGRFAEKSYDRLRTLKSRIFVS
ncbi:MAG: peptidoglycan bridge formation glycyltransferase FemA/FemB family protein [Candidatus Bathyarchaeia archaeon]